jgi:hypothetical protein
MANVKSPVEITKYIKIPDRRLISGFLTVNVVSHDDNDDYDDANQYYHDEWTTPLIDQLKKPFHPYNNNQPSDPGRAGFKHTFGDFDCLLFWVAGGMTLHPIIFNGGKMTQSQLYNGGGNNAWVNASSGPTTWAVGGTSFDSNEYWFSSITHSCQNFIKSHLVSRINNGYGHQNSPNNYNKIQGILTNQFEYSDNTTSEIITTDSSSGTPGSRGGNNYKYIVSNGVFSDDDDNTDDPADLANTSHETNTYFPMVQNVHIYGKHNYSLPTRFNNNDEPIYSSGNTSAGNFSHNHEYWDLVIKIQLRGYDSATGNGATEADKEFFRTRTNVSFHPFGETASFEIGDSLHS